MVTKPVKKAPVKTAARKLNKNIIVEGMNITPLEQQQVELVERKGIGHPDSISDGLAESVSRALCNMYLDKYGEVLHHNTDQNEVVGGQSAPKFGGGKMLEPIYIVLVGRAITQVGIERLEYATTAIEAAKTYLKRFPNLDVEKHTIVDCKIGKGSVDLIDNFDRKAKECKATGTNHCLLSNDTSFGCSFAPLTETETLTLETEHYINGIMKKKLKETGQDVKVMSARNGDKITMTIACAMVDKYIDDADHYISVVEQMKKLVHDQSAKYTDREVLVDINHADDYKNGSYYLTVTGLSAENGDDGSVGRGNRANGLITPYRPMSMEATAGKNPITHVGKMYNILSNWIARDIAKEGNGDILEVQVRLLSQIGRPISDPQTASIQIITAKGANFPKCQKKAYDICDDWLENIGKVTEKVVKGEVTVF
ncbi:MAG: methionine adenosyltransferase [Methanomassiliicoccales archaeon]